MAINNIDKIRAKIQADTLCVGTGITFTDPAISELIGDAGYDFTWIDMEHCPIDLATALGHVMAVRGTGAAPFIRVPSGDPNIIKPILELHPAAVVVPQVRGVDEVEQIVSACKYPPSGSRGFGPRRGRGFGGTPYPVYLQDADEQILVLVQIEHIDAVQALDDILAVEGLDGVCLGFNDLAASMGLAGQTNHPRVLQTAGAVVQQTRRAGRWMGLAMGYDREAVQQWVDQGVRWLSLGGDFNSLHAYAKGVLEEVRTLG